MLCAKNLILEAKSPHFSKVVYGPAKAGLDVHLQYHCTGGFSQHNSSIISCAGVTRR